MIKWMKSMKLDDEFYFSKAKIDYAPNYIITQPLRSMEVFFNFYLKC